MLVFLILSKIVSWARYGTSYQLLPLLSTTSKIPIIFEASISTVGNLVTDPNVKVVVLIVAEIAVLRFLSWKYCGLRVIES